MEVPTAEATLAKPVANTKVLVDKQVLLSNTSRAGMQNIENPMINFSLTQ